MFGRIAESFIFDSLQEHEREQDMGTLFGGVPEIELIVESGNGARGIKDAEQDDQGDVELYSRGENLENKKEGGRKSSLKPMSSSTCVLWFLMNLSDMWME